ncbi:MAG: restriction endonuclease subunit S, partial [Candidatus Zophobacter franzmannii]|nr:restriction endonuclease subunit S [Candidatus Zophobacter franzmannii]
PTSVGFKFTTEGINFIKVESIKANGEFISRKFAHISKECHLKLKRSQLESNDIVFSIAGALGRTALINDELLPANTNQALSIIRLNKDCGIHPSFILKMLSSNLVKNQVSKYQGGVAQQNLSLQQVKSFLITVPPLPEQERIVAFLDETLGLIEKGKLRIENNIRNAKELFQSRLNQIFENGKSNQLRSDNGEWRIEGEEWEEKKLGEIAKIMYGYTAKSSFMSEGIKYLRITDIKDGAVNWNNVPSCIISDDELLKYKLHKGDIVFARTGATTCKSYIIRDNTSAVFASYLIRVFLNSKDILPEFLYMFFQTKVYWDLIKKGISGAAQGGFNASKLSMLRIPKLPIAEQEKAIKEIDLLSKETKRLVEMYKKKLDDLEEMKKSILEQAFEGKLIIDN